MKKILFLFLLTSLIISSCNKWEDNEAVSTEQEVTFKSLQTSLDNLKSSCENPNAQYAYIKVIHSSGTEIELYPEVFYIGGTAFTQSIKLKPGTWTIQEFILYNDNMTPGNLSDDILVQGTPHVGSEYSEVISNPLPFTTQVVAFEKNEIPIEILCFEEVEYDSFGFNWFVIDQTSVRKQVFFGDLCTVNPNEYLGSLYANQSNGVQIDMPAIFKIKVYDNGDFVEEFTNASWYGESRPLEVFYVDKVGEVNHFTFELYILVKDGSNTFTYKHFHTWAFDDDEKIPAGSDNVVDFVLGDCMVVDVDLIIDPNNPEEPTDCGTCEGQITSLTLKLLEDVQNATIQVYTKKVKPQNLLRTFNNISQNDEFSFVGLADKDYKMGSKIYLVINGDTHHKVEIHTSCSVDIFVGQIWGNSYEITEGTSHEGGALCTGTPEPNCGECDGKMTSVTLKYIGPGTVNLRLYKDKVESGKYIRTILNVSTNDIFTINDDLKNGTLGTKIKLTSGFDDDDYTETEIHTSCSVDIAVGDVFKSDNTNTDTFVLIAGESKDGGPLCPGTDD